MSIGILAEPIQIKQGDDFHLEMTWEDDSATPIDTSGLVADMHLKSRPGAAILLDFSTTNDRITLGTGTITLDADAETTAALRVTSGVFDLQITYPDGRIATLFSGTFKLILDVTVTQ
ncbi:hypothetical protein H0A71_06155 [Alcaligenaceae bacterium]|nr:hypothetical protein [Alcaligenaceae bacterium]